MSGLRGGEGVDHVRLLCSKLMKESWNWLGVIYICFHGAASRQLWGRHDMTWHVLLGMCNLIFASNKCFFFGCGQTFAKILQQLQAHQPENKFILGFAHPIAPSIHPSRRSEAKVIEFPVRVIFPDGIVEELKAARWFVVYTAVFFNWCHRVIREYNDVRSLVVEMFSLFCIPKSYSTKKIRCRSDCKTFLQFSSRKMEQHLSSQMHAMACVLRDLNTHAKANSSFLIKRGKAPQKQSWRFLVCPPALATSSHVVMSPPIWCLAYWLSSSIRWAMCEGCWWIFVSRSSVFMCLKYYCLPPEILACLYRYSQQLLFERNYTFSKPIILGILFVCLGCVNMRPHTVDGSEIPNNKTSVNNGIHLPYQPLSGISEPSTGYRVCVNPVVSKTSKACSFFETQNRWIPARTVRTSSYSCYHWRGEGGQLTGNLGDVYLVSSWRNDIQQKYHKVEHHVSRYLSNTGCVGYFRASHVGIGRLRY